MRESPLRADAFEPPPLVEAALRCLTVAVAQMTPEPVAALGAATPARAWALRLDAPTGRLLPVAGVQGDRDAAAIREPLALPVPWEALIERGATLVEADHPGHAAWAGWLAACQARTMVVFPLLVGTRLLGVGVLASATPVAFSTPHERLCEAHGAMVALALDEALTKHRRACESAQLEDLLERLPDGLVVLDEAGAVARINPAARRVFGYNEVAPGTRFASLERGVLVQRPDGRPVAADRLPSSRLALRDAFADLEVLIAPPGRLPQAYQVTGVPLADASGRPVGTACLYRDRSRLWQREMELSALYALTAAAMEAPGIELLLERALGHILTLTHLPGGLLLYHGAEEPAPLLSHRGLSEALAAATVAFEGAYGLERLYRCLAASEPGQPEDSLRGLFAESLYSWVVLPLHRDERLLGLLVLGAADYSQLSDDLSKLLSTITNQLLMAIERSQTLSHMEELVAVRTTELLETNRRLEETVAELQRMDTFKTNFLSNVSHELRTPLSGIIGYGEFLADGAYGDLTDDQQRILEQLVKCSYQLLELINNLLDLSHIDAGRLKLYKEPIELGTLFEQSVGQVVPQAQQKGIRLEVPEGLSPTVEVDPGRVVQVLVNLLSNAIKFTPEEGTIRVSYRQHGDEITVAVADTGIGIPAEHLPFLFMRFSQVDGSHTRLFSGTGLGLAICRELIELHQQRIWVESAPGRGSTFYFTLPVWQVAPEPMIKKG